MDALVAAASRVRRVPARRRGELGVADAALARSCAIYFRAQCGGRAGDPQSNRLGGRGGGRRRAARCASASSAPPLVDAGGRLRRAARPVRGRAPLARAATWPCAACRCGPTWPPTRRPTTIRDAQERRVHIDYPIVADRVLGLGELPTRAPAARAGPRRARGRRTGARSTACSCGRTGCGSWSRTARSLYILVRHPQRFPRAAVMTYAVFDIGASVYWLLPTAPPVVRGLRGARGTATASRRVRRMMVEYGEHLLERRLGLALQCVRRQPSGRDALAALRHIRDGRAPARRGGSRWRARSAFAYAATLGFALVYLGEHYVVDLLGGRGADGRGAAAGAARAARRSHAWGARSRRWRRWPTRRAEDGSEREMAQDGRRDTDA